MREYTFFSYEVNEALHMSERERQTVLACFAEIQEELRHSIDRHSRRIITSHIEVLLNHASVSTTASLPRAKPSATTCSPVSRSCWPAISTPTSRGSSAYPSSAGVPDSSTFRQNYFGDLIKKETGKSAIEHIHLAIINRVKDLLASTGKTVSEIAYEVGFQYPHHLSRMFREDGGLHAQ